MLRRSRHSAHSRFAAIGMCQIVFAHVISSSSSKPVSFRISEHFSGQFVFMLKLLFSFQQVICLRKCQWAVRCQLDSQCVNEARDQRRQHATTIPVSYSLGMAGRHGGCHAGCLSQVWTHKFTFTRLRATSPTITRITWTLCITSIKLLLISYSLKRPICVTYIYTCARASDLSQMHESHSIRVRLGSSASQIKSINV